MAGRGGTIDSSGHQRRFLECFAACGRVVQAARWAKLSRNAHYNWMSEDPTYPARFKSAELRAARTLEDEAVRRAHEGLRKAVRYKGKVVGYETEYSDTLMVQLLRATNPEKFRERIEDRVDLLAQRPPIQIVFVSPGQVTIDSGSVSPRLQGPETHSGD